VLDIAPLIMVTVPTVSFFFSTCGCFLRDGPSPSRDLPPLSLACGWPPSVNGSPPANGGTSRALGLKILRVQGGGGGEPTSGVGQADRLATRNDALHDDQFGHKQSQIHHS
jgi:hypothetical protein